MKTRRGFVTNSSSSSFIVTLDFLNPLQVYALLNHIELAREIDVIRDEYGAGISGYVNYSDEWTIEDVEEGVVRAHTYMDNFDLYAFLVFLCGVPEKAIKIED